MRKLLIIVAAVAITVMLIIAFVPSAVPVDPNAEEDEPWVLFGNFEASGAYTIDEPIPALGLIKIVVPDNPGTITIKFIVANAGLAAAEDVRFAADTAGVTYCLKWYQYRMLFECEPTITPVFTLEPGERMHVTMTVEFVLWPVLIDLVEDDSGVIRVGPDRILISSV